MNQKPITPCPECSHSNFIHTMEGCLEEIKGKICSCERTFNKSINYKRRKRSMPPGIRYKKEAIYLTHLKGRLWY